MEQLNLAPDNKTRIWIADETRYGLISNMRRCWGLRGYRPKAVYHTRYEWAYLYGALEVGTGQAQFLHAPGVSLEWSLAYLGEISQTEPDAIHVVIWDQAGFHPGPEHPDIPQNVRLIPLPPYSPELNAVEQLWDPVKRHIANQAWDSLEKMEAAINEVIQPFWEKAQKVKDLLGDSWLTRGVDRFLQNHATAN